MSHRGLESLEASGVRGPVNDYRVQCAAVAYIIRKVGLFEDMVLERTLKRCKKKLEIIKVATSTLRQWYCHYQQYGDVPAVEKRQRSRRNRLKKNSRKRMPRSDHWPPALIQKLKDIVDEHPEYYLDEISEEFEKRTKITKSDSAIYKMLKRHPINYSLKKVTMIAAQRDEEERRDYAKAIRENVHRPKMACFIDETSKDPKDDKRRRMWCLRGSKAEMSEPLESDDSRYTMLGAGDVNGFVFNACEVVFRKSSDDDPNPAHGTIDTERFIQWVKEKLVPTLGRYKYRERRSVVIMDNAPIHHHPEVVSLIKKAGAIVIYTAPYSPDLNPIEYFFRLYKDGLKRSNRRRSMKDPLKAHRKALCFVKAKEARNIFRKCGVPGLGPKEEDVGIGADVMQEIVLDEFFADNY